MSDNLKCKKCTKEREYGEYCYDCLIKEYERLGNRTITCACCGNSSEWAENFNGNFCDSLNDLPVCDGCLQSGPIFETDPKGIKHFLGYKNRNKSTGLVTPEERMLKIMKESVEELEKREKRLEKQKVSFWGSIKQILRLEF